MDTFQSDDLCALLQRDTLLLSAIVPTPEASPGLDVFLTGSAGFVGAALLRQILEHSSASVFCHLRARNAEEGLRRLLASQRTLGSVPEAWHARIIPIVGDLGRPRLGMSELDWTQVTTLAGKIFHAGALVNHIAPYTIFRRPNVEASLEILRLSATGSQKEIHHISSLGYWSGYVGAVDERSRNVAGPGAQASGYLLSKWASDRLMEQAIDRGFPASIYRLGYVSGNQQGGFCNPRGWLELYLHAFARLKLMPDGETCLGITPVDLLAGDIWSLSRDATARGMAYNLAHREQLITMDAVEQAFGRIGPPVRRVPPDDWFEAFKAAPQDELMRLLEVFLSGPFPEFNPERHAFLQRVSSYSGARFGNPAPFPMHTYLDTMLSGIIESDRGGIYN